MPLTIMSPLCDNAPLGLDSTPPPHKDLSPMPNPTPMTDDELRAALPRCRTLHEATRMLVDSYWSTANTNFPHQLGILFDEWLGRGEGQ